MEVVNAGQKSLLVGLGHCWSAWVLHLLLHLPLSLALSKCQADL